MDPFKGLYPGHVYSEEDWNPITLAQAYENPANGYRASKTYAEKAAWEFIEKEKPNFTYVLNIVYILNAYHLSILTI